MLKALAETWSGWKTFGGAALMTVALTTGAAAAGGYTPAAPEPGADIPAATIKFGMRPYADNTFYVIGMKKGWFKEVGISFDPPPYGLKANDSNVTTLLLNGQLDIISEFCPLMLPTYKDADKLKCIAFTDNFLANAILANPALKLKTFKDYVAEGKPYEEALKLALAPMKGKTLVGAPELSDRAVRGICQQDLGRRVQAPGARRRQIAGARQGGPRGFRQSRGRADRLYAAPGRLDRSRRYRRSHQIRAGRRRIRRSSR